MTPKRLTTAALLLSIATPAFAGDPVYVVRPPIMQLRANVLPSNAFGPSSGPTSPTQPSTPPQSQYVFESHFFADSAAEWNVPIENGKVKVGNAYQIPKPKIAACDVSDTWPTSTKDAFFDEFGYTGIVTPKVTGKFALAMACDAVNNLPGSDPRSRYYGKVILTVIP